MSTLFQQHAAEWMGCTRCDLSECRKRVVLARGKVPCEVVFIGEGPGESENVVGKPFVGPAGKLLDRIIEDSLGRYNVVSESLGRLPITYAMTNLVACIPRDGENGRVSKPDERSIKACAPRLKAFIRLCDGLPPEETDDELTQALKRRVEVVPNIGRLKLIVTVGTLARDWLDEKRKSRIVFHREIPQVTIIHPSAILQKHTAHQFLEVQRSVVAIANALEEV
jgi:uracil-DNA glycosylase family 4